MSREGISNGLRVTQPLRSVAGVRHFVAILISSNNPIQQPSTMIETITCQLPLLHLLFALFKETTIPSTPSSLPLLFNGTLLQ